MYRRDKEAVIKSYLNCGYNIFGITVHGNAELHDELYLSLHQDCKLYLGNSGAETYCFGDKKQYLG